MTGPWAALPRQFAVELGKERQTLAAEIIREIRQQIPEFARPLDGKFGVGIQYGVETALAGFADLVAGVQLKSAEERLCVYRALGRGEFAEGRSLDALQAAYRLGARVAWRRYARTARRSGLSPDLLVAVAEAVFAHIDEIASASVQGYAEAKADDAGTLVRLRRSLLDLLVDGATREQVEKAAAAADWPLPEQAACVALNQAGRRRGGRLRLPDLVLSDLDGPAPFLLVPQPALFLQDGQVRAVMLERGAVVGPTVPFDLATDSLRWARAVAAGARPRSGSEPLTCDGRLPDLLLLADAPLVRLMAQRRLQPLAGMTPKQSERLGVTLLAWLQTNRGSAPEVAARLGIHPQTARQRLHRVQELFGAALNDPDARFELEVALRGRLFLTAPALDTPPVAARTPSLRPQ
ncbi:helix-turn-helix domain-containing protein [Streptacidiphilus sp. PAMC 29251]